ncbi:hypothetical protein [Stackebrandtia albiflava]|nr:hypothetical protein [Stackebrandtia albiflava]
MESVVDGDPSGRPMELPALDELRRGSSALSVLDRVLYPPSSDESAGDEPSVLRRQITAVSLRIVADATRLEPSIPSACIEPHATGEDYWPDRFAELADRVACAVEEAALTARVLAQCARVPAGLDRLVSVMAATATAELIMIDGVEAAVRSHLVEAAECADLAWCAAHSRLTDCPTWRRRRVADSERAILIALRRYLIPEQPGGPDPSVTVPVEAADPPGRPVKEGPADRLAVPAPMLELVSRLLRDGRWPTDSQRRIAAETRHRLSGYTD